MDPAMIGEWAFKYGPGWALNVVLIIMVVRYVPRLIDGHLDFMGKTKITQSRQATALGHIADGIEALAEAKSVRPHTEAARLQLREDDEATKGSRG